MSERRTDPVDALLADLRVPAPSPGLIERIAAEAVRPDRVPALPPAPARRRPVRPWSRRGVWTAVLAVNLMLASAVAAAFGTGAITGSRIAAVAQHVVDRFRPAKSEPRLHHAALHHAHPAVRSRHAIAAEPRLMLPAGPTPMRPSLPPAAFRPAPYGVVDAPPRRMLERRLARRALRLRSMPAADVRQRLARKAWRQERRASIQNPDGPRAGAALAGGYRRFGLRQGIGPGSGFGERRFDRPRFGRGERLGMPRWRRGGAGARPWGGRRGPPRRRF